MDKSIVLYRCAMSLSSGVLMLLSASDGKVSIFFISESKLSKESLPVVVLLNLPPFFEPFQYLSSLIFKRPGSNFSKRKFVELLP